jgi:regulator of replication initiation timing
MADNISSELFDLLEKQKSALRKNNYRDADSLSHKISSFIHENTHIRFTKQQSKLITQSLAQVELILTSQKQTVSQQLQTLRSRKNMLKTYQDQAKT